MSTVFYSWQSDLPETRGVIQWALNRATKNLNRDLDLDEPLRVDQDTEGVAGWPDITSALFDKIDQCEIFVADITPINGPNSDFRITPNPNVLLELGYALGTGLGRTRIICVINTHYLPDGDLGKLPFDLRGSRPVQFTLEDPARRGVESGQEDPIRTTARRDLAASLHRSLQEAIRAIQEVRDSRILGITPHLATNNLQEFQVVLDVQSPVPFQIDYLITEPGGNLLSGLMLSPASVDPEDRQRVRFEPMTLKALSANNETYVLSGKVAHLPTSEKPVPRFVPFEVQYRAASHSEGSYLLEVSRQDPPPH